MKIWQILLSIKTISEKHAILLDRYLDLNTPEAECEEIHQELFILERMAEADLRLLNSLTN